MKQLRSEQPAMQCMKHIRSWEYKIPFLKVQEQYRRFENEYRHNYQTMLSELHRRRLQAF